MSFSPAADPFRARRTQFSIIQTTVLASEEVPKVVSHLEHQGSRCSHSYNLGLRTCLRRVGVLSKGTLRLRSSSTAMRPCVHVSWQQASRDRVLQPRFLTDGQGQEGGDHDHDHGQELRPRIFSRKNKSKLCSHSSSNCWHDRNFPPFTAVLTLSFCQ